MSENKSPLISIIVPVYNVEKYLPKCIDSILAQTYTTFELLLIDDGSPDRSGAICDEYAARDPRIRVSHKPNGGVSSARNMGLNNARGEWITFVDSDDWIECSYIADFFIINKKADMYIQGYQNINKGKTENVIKFDNLGFFDDLTKIVCYGEKNSLLNSPWGKLFLNYIIQNRRIIFDDKTSYGEDHLFVLDYLMNCNSICVSNKAGYIYNHHEDSLTTKNIPYKDILYYAINAKMKLQIVIIKHGITELDSFINHWYGHNIVKAIMYFFRNPSKQYMYLNYTEIISEANPIVDFKTNSVFMSLFKIGFRFHNRISYLYFKCLTKIYYILKKIIHEKNNARFWDTPRSYKDGSTC